MRRCASHRLPETIGIRGIVVYALSEDARRFYRAIGFTECPGEPMMLAVTLADIRAALMGP